MRNEVVVEGKITYKKTYGLNTFFTLLQEVEPHKTYVKCASFKKVVPYAEGTFVKVTGKVSHYYNKEKKTSSQNVIVNTIVPVSSGGSFAF
jgi:hypothetical protein